MTLGDLIAAHRPGHALARPFYDREDVFAADMQMLLDRWTCVGHVSEIPQPGDYITAELGRESAIIVRGRDGAVGALMNVCRHRGSRICRPGPGHAEVLVCPYHAWSYQLDGRLRAAREMPEGFDPAAYALKPLSLAIVAGLIFVSFGGAPPGLAEVERALGRVEARYRWSTARIAARKSYAVCANWKLVMENYHECYHCAPAHPEFSVHHLLARPKNRDARAANDVEAWGAEPDGEEVARLIVSPLAERSLTGSRDGALLAPVMDAEGPAGECVFAEAGFLSAFLAYADHGVIYRFIPRAPLMSEMEVIWLVRGEAEAGRDFDVERLTWLWDVTSQADKRIIEMNQAGVLSRAFEPGPFSKMEPGTAAYVARYLEEMKERRAASGPPAPSPARVEQSRPEAGGPKGEEA